MNSFDFHSAIRVPHSASILVAEQEFRKNRDSLPFHGTSCPAQREAYGLYLLYV